MEDFTKGEWKVDATYSTFININTDSACIASVDVEGSIYSEEELANAHLIAAAPDMYAILEKLMKAMDNHDVWWVNCPDSGGFDTNEIEDLLKKARGE